MSKYFGKVVMSSFWLRCASFLLSKFASQLKLIQSVVRVRRLRICVTSSIFRVLLSEFWVSGPQFPSLGDPFQGSWLSESQSPRVSGPRVLGLRVSGLPGYRVSGFWGPKSQVLILDYALRKELLYDRSRTGVLKNFAKSTEKHFCQGLVFNKIAGGLPLY